jgi:mono/diheme cytochrome c family protein
VTIPRSFSVALATISVALLGACAHASAGAVVSAVAVPGARPAGTPTATPVSGGLYTDVQAKRGAAVYKEQCASCHFDDLGGNDCAPPLVGRAFYERWNGHPLGEMYESISQSMPVGKPSLSSQQYIDVISYVLSANKLSAGTAELPPVLAQLNAINLRLPEPEQ